MARIPPRVTQKPAPVPTHWLVKHVGHFAPEMGRDVAVFWDEQAAHDCARERNRLTVQVSVVPYAYA